MRPTGSATRRPHPRTPIGEAIERGRPIFIDEGQRESLFPDVEGQGAATASVPLRVADETIGALGFRFARGHVFDDDEREFAVTMGEQCAYALERATRQNGVRLGRSQTARDVVRFLPAGWRHMPSLGLVIRTEEAVRFGGGPLPDAVFADCLAAIRPLFADHGET